jgi:hypothetical protein
MLATTHETKRMAIRAKNLGKSRGNERLTKAQVRSMIQSNNNLIIEKKVCTFSSSAGTTASGTVHNLLNPITRGDAAINQFDGNQLRPCHLRFRGEWSTDQVFSTCRLMIFQWDEALVPTPSGLLVTTGTALAPLSPLLWINKCKIKVLYDEITTLFPSLGASAATNFQLDLKSGFKTISMNTVGTYPQTNGIFALAITDDLLVSYPQLKFYSELIFTDA